MYAFDIVYLDLLFIDWWLLVVITIGFTWDLWLGIYRIVIDWTRVILIIVWMSCISCWIVSVSQILIYGFLVLIERLIRLESRDNFIYTPQIYEKLLFNLSQIVEIIIVVPMNFWSIVSLFDFIQLSYLFWFILFCNFNYYFIFKTPRSLAII